MTSSVYRIRNGKGLWSNGGASPSFSTRGKAWVSIGALKSHLRQMVERYGHEARDEKEPWRKIIKTLPSDWEIVEFVVVENNTDLIKPANDYVEVMKRRETMIHYHGEAFANLVDRLEPRGEDVIYQWCLCSKDTAYGHNIQQELLNLVKSKKLKRGTDIQTAMVGDDTAVAFKDKAQAMLFKLEFKHKLTAVNIKEFVETNLDT